MAQPLPPKIPFPIVRLLVLHLACEILQATQKEPRIPYSIFDIACRPDPILRSYAKSQKVYPVMRRTPEPLSPDCCQSGAGCKVRNLLTLLDAVLPLVQVAVLKDYGVLGNG